MKIYIGINNNISEVIKRKISSEIVSSLKKYYGKFSEDDVKYYINDNLNTIDVFIMDQAKYSGYEKVISDLLKVIINKNIGDGIVNVALNYNAFDPNFDPTVSLNSSAAEKVQKEFEEKNKSGKSKSDEFDYDKLSENYHAEDPHYSFEQVILPENLKTQIEEAVGTILVEHQVFDEWGLRTIIPNASSALSFYGPPGTGKSMAAEAIAQKLGKKILRATYADIESKFHGEGPKMVKAIFRAAERDDAVLFLDESDSLLSKRLTNVTDGSAQAINSMRSQLLICLEQFKGIVIFATNLVVNYDKAFLSRLINIEFVKPDADARYAIWYQHLKGKGLCIPLAEDVNIHELAEKYEFCGREIKNSVKDACVITAIAKEPYVSQANLMKAAEKTKVEYEKVMSAEDHTVAKKQLSEETKNVLKDAMQKQLDNAKEIKSENI